MQEEKKPINKTFLLILIILCALFPELLFIVIPVYYFKHIKNKKTKKVIVKGLAYDFIIGGLLFPFGLAFFIWMFAIIFGATDASYLGMCEVLLTGTFGFVPLCMLLLIVAGIILLLKSKKY